MDVLEGPALGIIRSRRDGWAFRRGWQGDGAGARGFLGVLAGSRRRRRGSLEGWGVFLEPVCAFLKTSCASLEAMCQPLRPV